MEARHGRQALVGAGVLAVAALLAAGATQIGGEAGYGGVGPAFLPWCVAALLTVCGVMLLREALGGGFRDAPEPEGDERGYWPGFVWVSAGILVNAATITRIGFIFSCALCYVLAARGFTQSQGRLERGPLPWLRNAAIGIAIAAPVYWMFTKALAINLPGLTDSGWL